MGSIWLAVAVYVYIGILLAALVWEEFYNENVAVRFLVYVLLVLFYGVILTVNFVLHVLNIRRTFRPS